MAAVYVCSRTVSVRAPYRKWNAHGKVSGRLSRFAALRRREGPMALGGQFNRNFVVGLAGATIVSLGLFALSRAGGEIGDVGRAKLKAHVRLRLRSTTDCTDFPFGH